MLLEDLRATLEIAAQALAPMTLAAIDRLVHRATILEMNAESYRRKAELKRKRGKGD